MKQLLRVLTQWKAKQNQQTTSLCSSFGTQSKNIKPGWLIKFAIPKKISTMFVHFARFFIMYSAIWQASVCTRSQDKLRNVKSYCKTTHIEAAISPHLFSEGNALLVKGQWIFVQEKKTCSRITWYEKPHWMRHKNISSFDFTWNHFAFTLKPQSVGQHS